MTTAERLAQLFYDGICDIEVEECKDEEGFVPTERFAELSEEDRAPGVKLFQDMLDNNVIRVGPGFTLRDVEDVKL